MLKQSEILEMFQSSGAYLEGHFLLTSGLHSPNYFQCAKVLQYPKYMTLLCMDLAKRLMSKEIDVIIGPAIGGIVVAQETGRILNKRTIFSERENEVMSLRRGFELSKGERVAIVEDVFTTGRSIREVSALVQQKGAVLSAVGVIVDRSGGNASVGTDIESLLSMDVIKYEPDKCPLCDRKVDLVKPGSRKQP